MDNLGMQVPGGSGSGYATVEDEGTPLTQRTTLNFVGGGVTATDSGGKTVVTISGAAGGSWNPFTQDLGTARRSGTFDVTGVSGLTLDDPVQVVQTSAPITSKGDARDEAEMDQINLVAHALGATSFRVYWWAPTVVVGIYAFAWR